MIRVRAVFHRALSAPYMGMESLYETLLEFESKVAATFPPKNDNPAFKKKYEDALKALEGLTALSAFFALLFAFLCVNYIKIINLHLNRGFHCPFRQNFLYPLPSPSCRHFSA